MKHSLAVAALLLILASQCIAQKTQRAQPREWRDMVNTEITGPNCTPVTNIKEPHARICKGVEGYSLLIKGDELKPEVFVITPKGQQYKLHYWNTADPGYQGLQTTVGWIVVYKAKTISLTFSPQVARKEDYNPYSDQYETIARLSPGPICIVGSVPVGPNYAMESTSIASSPAKLPCLTFDQYEQRDWFLTARRLAGEGKVQEAQSALQRLKQRSERFIVYREISNAQFKSGDREGALRTLMTARSEALKNPFLPDRVYTLGYVVYGLTEAGFYDEAKANIEYFDESDKLSTRLSIASLQAERKDLDAAKITFREAIQVELNRQPRMDWNLLKIAESQAHMRLFDEARKTATLIIDPDAKKSAESYLPKQP